MVNDQQGRLALCKYILRPPLANDRLKILDDGNVRIEFKKRWSELLRKTFGFEILCSKCRSRRGAAKRGRVSRTRITHLDSAMHGSRGRKRYAGWTKLVWPREHHPRCAKNAQEAAISANQHGPLDAFPDRQIEGAGRSFWLKLTATGSFLGCNCLGLLRFGLWPECCCSWVRRQ